MGIRDALGKVMRGCCLTHLHLCDQLKLRREERPMEDDHVRERDEGRVWSVSEGKKPVMLFEAKFGSKKRGSKIKKA